MNGLESPTAVWGLVLVQVLGLASAWLARISEGSSRQTASQCLFLPCMALAGAATLVAMMMGPGYWLMSATALAAMTLMATCDFGRHEQVDAG